MTKCNDRKEQRRYNTGLAKVAVRCSVDTFVVNESLVLRMKNCGKNCYCVNPQPALGYYRKHVAMKNN